MIENAALTDIDTLCNIENQVFMPWEGRFSKRVFFYHLHYGDRIFILRKNGEIVGYLLVLTHSKSLRIYSLAVLPKFQGKGYGEILCRYGIDMARAKKKDFIYLEVRSRNQKAIALYEKLGFVSKKVLPSYYVEEDGLRMENRL
ncbi:hypothetical protein BKH41_00405 [Helicobacter sp. 12S02232-10]|uniref:GNAT family N-acetyltransferase n=1 Tax=Helicobacter sp. 12S02232-10 TaxID=1476197 RepID=UPI000BA52D07|nr:GNAT family N-acetyltransferase [Helicobacter sp. 12S02232-10]PAF49801.1 hypothetical protein BKH41_00405 [Helicobacter sp. 12S02232-10]